MSEEQQKPKHVSDAEEVSEILGVVSEKIPALIKGVISSVFSEEAAREMGRAAAGYYSELKRGGIPDEDALKMTRDYVGMLTNISEILKGVRPGKGGEIGEEIKKQILEKTKEREE